MTKITCHEEVIMSPKAFTDNFVISVTVTFNPSITLLVRQLQSLAGQVDMIVIVDNNSGNVQEIERIRLEQFPNVELICLEENTGLGAAQNTGIEYAREHNASDVLLLDQDSVLGEACLSRLLAARNELESVGENIAAVGTSYFNEKTKNVYPISKYYGPFIKRIIPTHSPVKASFLIASGCLINLMVFEKIGLMNEQLFIDYVDIEWSFRAQAKGYELYAIPDALMIHSIGENSFEVAGREISNHGALRRYYLCRNSISMIKNSDVPLGYKIRESILNTLRLFMFLIFSSNRRIYLKYSLQGFRDGINNIGGRCKHNFN